MKRCSLYFLTLNDPTKHSKIDLDRDHLKAIELVCVGSLVLEIAPKKSNYLEVSVLCGNVCCIKQWLVYSMTQLNPVFAPF